MGRKDQKASQPRVVQPGRCRGGYLKVDLSEKGHRRCLRLNRLVLSAFTGENPPHLHAAHRNGRRADNRLANLYWATSAENYDDKVRHGTARRGRAWKISIAHMKVRRAQLMRDAYAASVSRAILCEDFGVSDATVSRVLNGRISTPCP